MPPWPGSGAASMSFSAVSIVVCARLSALAPSLGLSCSFFSGVRSFCPRPVMALPNF